MLLHCSNFVSRPRAPLAPFTVLLQHLLKFSPFHSFLFLLFSLKKRFSLFFVLIFLFCRLFCLFLFDCCLSLCCLSLVFLLFFFDSFCFVEHRPASGVASCPLKVGARGHALGWKLGCRFRAEGVQPVSLARSGGCEWPRHSLKGGWRAASHHPEPRASRRPRSYLPTPAGAPP